MEIDLDYDGQYEAVAVASTTAPGSYIPTRSLLALGQFDAESPINARDVDDAVSFFIKQATHVRLVRFDILDRDLKLEGTFVSKLPRLGSARIEVGRDERGPILRASIADFADFARQGEKAQPTYTALLRLKTGRSADVLCFEAIKSN